MSCYKYFSMQFSGEELTFRRVFNYVFGLYLITLGVAFSIKSGLGSAPVSSIPYAINLIWMVEIGLATFIFHAFLVFIELILLKKDFKRKHFLQVFVGVLFGIFTSFSVALMNFIPPADTFVLALLMSFLSIFQSSSKSRNISKLCLYIISRFHMSGGSNGAFSTVPFM